MFTKWFNKKYLDHYYVSEEEFQEYSDIFESREQMEEEMNKPLHEMVDAKESFFWFEGRHIFKKRMLYYYIVGKWLIPLPDGDTGILWARCLVNSVFSIVVGRGLLEITDLYQYMRSKGLSAIIGGNLLIIFGWTMLIVFAMSVLFNWYKAQQLYWDEMYGDIY